MTQNRLILLFILTITALFYGWNAGASSVVNTKHDLSYSSLTPTYKATFESPGSGGTDEVCVFCHTPHGGSTDAPLWNRSFSASAYTVYQSDVMTALSITPEDPFSGAASAIHLQKTRVCLSCHDGTIALGSVINMPTGIDTMTYSAIPMNGQLSDTSAAGYIGLDLRDDHPVAVEHNQAQDNELVNGPSVVRLYSYNSKNWVECTSCHNPHDDQYGNFLIESNSGSQICTRCHNKMDFPGSIHSTSTASYSPPSLGSTVGGVKCMNCHFPHKAGVTTGFPTTPNEPSGKYLLSFQEEASCFNNTNRWGQTPISACHGSAAVAARAIEPLVNAGKTYYHQVMNSGWLRRHTATEARQNGWAGNTLHVECDDCHNSHTAKNVLHTRGTNTVGSSSPLYGASGVSAGSYPSWNPPGATGTYNVIQAAGVTNNSATTVTYEYEICLKCHSDFAWGAGPLPTPTILNQLGVLTNQAMEFGSGTSSHPIISSTANTQGTYVNPWTNGSQTMYCSDCHNNDTARSPFGTGSDPVGPHGSDNRSILKKSYDPATIGTNSAELCFDCHDYSKYYSTNSGGGTGFYNGTYVNLHYQHMNPSGFSYQGSITKTCTRCHVNPPHGINKAHLISYATGTGATPDPAPYGTYSYVKSYTNPGSGNYVGTNCSAATCHLTAHP